MLFFLTFCSLKNPEKKKNHRFHKILSSTTVFNIDKKKSWAANQHIKMISEGSRDTDDWSNDAEIQLSFAGIHYILKDTKIENS